MRELFNHQLNTPPLKPGSARKQTAASFPTRTPQKRIKTHLSGRGGEGPSLDLAEDLTCERHGLAGVDAGKGGRTGGICERRREFDGKKRKRLKVVEGNSSGAWSNGTAFGASWRRVRPSAEVPHRSRISRSEHPHHRRTLMPHPEVAEAGLCSVLVQYMSDYNRELISGLCFTIQ